MIARVAAVCLLILALWALDRGCGDVDATDRHAQPAFPGPSAHAGTQPAAGPAAQFQDRAYEE